MSVLGCLIGGVKSLHDEPSMNKEGDHIGRLYERYERSDILERIQK